MFGGVQAVTWTDVKQMVIILVGLLVCPLVVISRFSGTPADGHGHHQFAGYISPLAVKATADANQCTDSGAAWQVQKFYVEQGFRSNDEPTLKINTGEYNFLLGRSYAEIAAEDRSQHKTQEQGGLELKGDRFSGLNLIESKVPKVKSERSIFDGIDVSIKNYDDLVGLKDYAKKEFIALQLSADKAAQTTDIFDGKKLLPALLEGVEKARNLKNNINGYLYEAETFRLEALKSLVADKEKEFTQAIKLASGLQIDALANKETVTPDENFLTSVKVFYPENSNIKIKEIKLNAPKNWQISDGEEPKSDSPFARFFRATAKNAKFFNVKVAPDAKLTETYFLEKPRDGALYNWNNDESQTEPFQKPILAAEITAEIDGAEIIFKQPVEYRYADGVRGEIRRNLNVVPKISLNLAQDLLIVPKGDKPQI